MTVKNANMRTIAACEFSPKHKSALLNALNNLRNPSIARCAALMKKMTKTLSIGEFPNPFPHGTPDHFLWREGFDGEASLTTFGEEELEEKAPSPKGWPEAWKGDAPEDPEKAADAIESAASEVEEEIDTPPADPIAPGSEDTARETEKITAEEVAPLEDILGDILGDSTHPDAPADERDPNLPSTPNEEGTGDPGPAVEVSDPLAEILGDSSGAGGPAPDPAPRAVVPD